MFSVCQFVELSYPKQSLQKVGKQNCGNGGNYGQTGNQCNVKMRS